MAEASLCLLTLYRELGASDIQRREAIPFYSFLADSHVLEERVEKLESQLEETKKLATLGRCAEKILFELSN